MLRRLIPLARSLKWSDVIGCPHTEREQIMGIQQFENVSKIVQAWFYLTHRF